MLVNEYLREHMKEMRELAAKPQPKRSQAEAYAQYDRFKKISEQQKQKEPSDE